MEIAFHLGAHATDEGALLQLLQRNQPLLAEQDIAVPGTGLYPDFLRMAARGFAGQEIGDAPARAALLSALCGGSDPSRLVLSFESFPGFAHEALGASGFYPLAEPRARVLGEIFAGHRLSLYFCLRNPATFLPQINARRAARALAPLHPAANALPSWSTVIASLHRALPEAQITIWCDEDAPVIWPLIARTLGGYDEASEPEGLLDYPSGFLSPATDAARRMRAWFDTRRPAGDAARARALRDWLRRAGDDTPVVAGLPGWSAAQIAAVTAAYDEDCARIARMPFVQFLLPPAE